MSSKQHVRRVFQWLEQVNGDKNLPSSAFKIAFVIAQHLNEESGEAWPSTETIGSLCALYPSSVRAMINNLVEHGHLSVEWGRKGRGHPNKYRLILKPQQPAVSTRSKKPQQPAALKSRRKPQPDEIKPRPDDLKTAAGCHEPLKNHLSNHLTKAGLRPAALVDRVETDQLTEAENTADDAPLNPAFTSADATATAEPLRPIPRAADAARIEPAKQTLPCQAASEMGRGANANGANAAGGRATWRPYRPEPRRPEPPEASFEKVKRWYPKDLIGDEADAFAAFRQALDAGAGLADLILGTMNIQTAARNGEDCPLLRDFLKNECSRANAALAEIGVVGS